MEAAKQLQNFGKITVHWLQIIAFLKQHKRENMSRHAVLLQLRPLGHCLVFAYFAMLLCCKSILNRSNSEQNASL